MPGEGRSKSRTLLWGCTGGCLGFVVILAIMAFVGARLLSAPMPVPPPEAFVPDGTGGFAVIRIAPDDPFMLGFVAELAQMQQVKRARAFPQEEGVVALGRGNTMEDFLAIAPVQLVGVVSIDEDGEELQKGVAVSIHRHGRDYGLRMRLAMKAPVLKAGAAEERGRTTIWTSPQGWTAGLNRNTFMFAEDEATVAAWAGRLTEWSELRERADDADLDAPAPALGIDEELKAAYGRLNSAAPVRFVCSNANGELEALLDKIETESGKAMREAGLASADVKAISGQIEGVSDKDAVATVHILCAGEAIAARLAAGLVASGERATVDGALMTVEILIEDAAKQLAAKMAGAAEPPGPPPPPPPVAPQPAPAETAESE